MVELRDKGRLKIFERYGTFGGKKKKQKEENIRN